MNDDVLLPADLLPLPPDEYWKLRFQPGASSTARGLTVAMILSAPPRRWWKPATWFAREITIAAGGVSGGGRQAAIDAMHKALKRRQVREDYRDLTDSLDRLSKRLR